MSRFNPKPRTSVAQTLQRSAAISLGFGVVFFMVMLVAFFMAVPPVLAFLFGTIRFLGIPEQGGFLAAIVFWVFVAFILTSLVLLIKRSREG
jgi:hypothetical protein